MSAYAVSHSPVFQGGYFKFSAPYLQSLPIRRIDWSRLDERRSHEEIVKLVDRAQQLRQELDDEDVAHVRTALKRALDAANGSLNERVNQLYGVTSGEARTIATILDENARSTDGSKAEKADAIA